MKIRPILILGLLAIALWITRVPAAPQQKLGDLAQKSAESWLALTDASNYADSWAEAAQFFKNAVTQPQWTNQIKAVRGPLGKMQSRKLKSATFTKSLPGAPDGQYVVIQYATSFEHKPSAIETVTPMLDKDGQWRVSGYYIK